MAKNWAIAIGVNQYDFLQPLKYAKRDAQLMQDFLRTEAGFERIFFFSDDSPDINGKSTRPTRANLRQVLLSLFKTPFQEAGDNFWFFFSGHGIRHSDRDYLLPSDGNPTDIEETAIQFEVVTVNAQGKITNRSNREAKYLVEDLGKGVTLEMVQIPGGTFKMGSPTTEAKRKSDESPQHQVTVPEFFMGKFKVTQAQYKAIMGSNPSHSKTSVANRPMVNMFIDFIH